MLSPRLQRAVSRETRLCLGILSGTSMDAAEAAICRISGSGATATLEVVSHLSVPFKATLKQRILYAATPAQLSDLNFELGSKFADAALAVIAHARLTPEDIDVVGSHGQTV